MQFDSSIRIDRSKTDQMTELIENPPDVQNARFSIKARHGSGRVAL